LDSNKTGARMQLSLSVAFLCLARFSSAAQDASAQSLRLNLALEIMYLR